MVRMNMAGFQPGKSFFIGVDSDGTVFDSMTAKHDGAMIPAAIAIWDLQKVAAEYTRAAEHINLYSRHRGVNRFRGLLMTFEELEKDPAVRGGSLPDYAGLREFVEENPALSGKTLAAFRRKKDSAFLRQLQEWSESSDRLFAQKSQTIGPFPGVKAALAQAAGFADLMVVSSAAGVGLAADWGRAGLLEYVALVAGQEAGTKSHQLAAAAEGRYPAGHILMIGDAPGDREAARAAGALFYPIVPGQETACWKMLCAEGLERFHMGQYAGACEAARNAEFDRVLAGAGASKASGSSIS